MRIIAGQYKGRTIKGPKHEGLRPTADRVREALFNILGTKILDADVLDLFAGTGAVGIESLSRGAQTVTFVDVHRESLRLLQENLSFVAPETFKVLKMDAQRALTLFVKEGTSFDLIFLDPPFDAGLYLQIMAAIRENQLVRVNGILIVEHPQKLALPTMEWDMLLSRNYGDIGLTFLSPI